jgi:hypothetical protein
LGIGPKTFGILPGGADPMRGTPDHLKGLR